MKAVEKDEPEHLQRSASKGRDADFVVVMGIAGTGKTEIGKRLAAALGCPFVEADRFHSSQNVERMRQGIGLTDDDRWPWLNAVCDAALCKRHPAVIACSVLKRSYRDLFRKRLGAVRFVFLDGPTDLISERLNNRRNHFASVSLVESQLKTLEPPSSDERPIVVDISKSPKSIIESVVRTLDASAR